MQSFGLNGRLGNQLFQYFFLRIVEYKYGCKVNLPNYPQNQFFAPQLDPNFDYANHESIDISSGSITEDLNLISQKISVADLNISGYFQYHTSAYDEDCRLLLHSLFDPRVDNANHDLALKKLLTELDQILDSLLKNKFVITLHVRRTDYLTASAPEFYSLNFDCFYEDLLKIYSVNNMRNLLIYVASDDLVYCLNCAEKLNLKIVTSRNFEQFDPLVLDFYFMMFADLLFAANSSLSVMASMLNRKAKMFRRPHPNQTEYISYHPWNTPILLKKNSF